jgi:hypothetical protein
MWQTTTRDMVNQIADWKRDKGFIVTTASLGDRRQLFQYPSYIRTPINLGLPPEYIMLIGDTNGTSPSPRAPCTTTATPCWTAGHSAEAFIGRVSIESSSNLSPTSARSIVERQPYLSDLSFYNHSLLVGDALIPAPPPT